MSQVKLSQHLPTRRELTAGAALAATALLLAACGGAPGNKAAQSTSSGSPAAGSITIGGVGPLSQPGAVSSGLDMKWAEQQAVSDINAAGGMLGKKVSLVFEDTQNRADVAAAAAKQLVDSYHVVGVAGEYHSSAAEAQIPVYTKSGTPVVFAETYADAITGGDPTDPSLPASPPTVFRIAPTSTLTQTQLADWITKGIKAHSVVELYEASDFGISQQKALKASLAGTGVKLTQLQVALNQTDYTSVLQRVKQQHPDTDLVIFDVTGDSSYVIENNAFQVGLIKSGTVCNANQVASDSAAYWRAVANGVGCVFRLAGPVPKSYDAQAKSLAQRYQRQFHQSPKAWIFEAYDSVRLIADAVAKAGTTGHAAVVRALEGEHYQGTLGQISFPYGSQKAVPSGQPSWYWHQWLNPPLQLVEYTSKGQAVADAAVVWPPDRQTQGTAYVQPQG